MFTENIVVELAVMLYVGNSPWLGGRTHYKYILQIYTYYTQYHGTHYTTF